MHFLKHTIYNRRVIYTESLSDMLTWIYASYAFHPDIKRHNGGAMSLGWGLIHCRPSKQKLNTKSSTEPEVIGLSDCVIFNISIHIFVKSQGYPLK